MESCNKEFDELDKELSQTPAYNQAKQLYNNGTYYLAINEFPGALVSYSCAAVLFNTFVQDNPNQASPIQIALKNILTCCLKAIENLQQKVSQLSSNGKNANDDDAEKDWEKICTKIQPLVFKKGGSECIFFQDVAGLFIEKKLMDESLIKPLQYPNIYPAASRGLLIYGPPGTGKTYLVKAAVNELQSKDPNVGILFFAPSPGDFKGKYVGETEKKIEEVFVCASKAACTYQTKTCVTKNKKYRSIIFMDEMDAIAPDRNDDPTGLAVNSVNTLLQMMDGIKSKPNVTVIAATNYPWSLDSAILRRFDSQIFIDVPNENDLFQLMDIQMRTYMNIDKNVSDSCINVSNNDKLIAGCELECLRKVAPDVLGTAPYSNTSFSFFEPNNQTEIKSIVSKMVLQNFSNSDLSTFMKTAQRKSGEYAINSNIFYNINQLGDVRFQGKGLYVSSLSKIKDIDKSIKLSIEIINSLISNASINNNNYYFVEIPNIVKIVHNGYVYYNLKCLLCKPEIVLNDPHIKDIYVKAHKIGEELTFNTYLKNILGKTSKNSIKTALSDLERLQNATTDTDKSTLITSIQKYIHFEVSVNELKTRYSTMKNITDDINSLKRSLSNFVDTASNYCLLLDPIHIIMSFDNIKFVENLSEKTDDQNEIYPITTDILEMILKPLVNTFQSIKEEGERLSALDKSQQIDHLKKKLLNDVNYSDVLEKTGKLFTIANNSCELKPEFKKFAVDLCQIKSDVFLKYNHNLNYLKYLHLYNATKEDNWTYLDNIYIKLFGDDVIKLHKKRDPEGFSFSNNVKQTNITRMDGTIINGFIDETNNLIYITSTDYLSMIDTSTIFELDHVTAIRLGTDFLEIPFPLFYNLFNDVLFMPENIEDPKFELNNIHKLMQILMDDLLNYILIVPEKDKDSINRAYKNLSNLLQDQGDTDEDKQFHIINAIIQRAYDNCLLRNPNPTTTTTNTTTIGGNKTFSNKNKTKFNRNNPKLIRNNNNNTIKKYHYNVNHNNISGGANVDYDTFLKWIVVQSKENISDSRSLKIAEKTAFVHTYINLDWSSIPENTNIYSTIYNTGKYPIYGRTHEEVLKMIVEKNVLLATLFKKIDYIGFIVGSGNENITESDDVIIKRNKEAGNNELIIKWEFINSDTIYTSFTNLFSVFTGKLPTLSKTMIFAPLSAVVGILRSAQPIVSNIMSSEFVKNHTPDISQLISGVIEKLGTLDFNSMNLGWLSIFIQSVINSLSGFVKYISPVELLNKLYEILLGFTTSTFELISNHIPAVIFLTILIINLFIWVNRGNVNNQTIINNCIINQIFTLLRDIKTINVKSLNISPHKSFQDFINAPSATNNVIMRAINSTNNNTLKILQYIVFTTETMSIATSSTSKNSLVLEKSRLINIEIPLSAFHFALFNTKSTYPKGLALQLKQYNEDKDAFMLKREEDRKKGKNT
jgi:DNA polymerase III delta prime subunit